MKNTSTLKVILVATSFLLLSTINAQIITTVAGNGVQGYSGDGSLAINASLSYPGGVAVDAAGNIYIADAWNNRVRKVEAATGIITTVAGNGTGGFSGDGGLATSAALNNPYSVAVDASNNIYIADTYNTRIRKVDASTGIITTVAGNGVWSYSGDGGAATNAAIGRPMGVAVDAAGNIYISDDNNNKVRRVDVTTGIISTFAGGGSYPIIGDGQPAQNSYLAGPGGIAVDASGNVYISEQYGRRIRKVDASTGIINTIAGTGANGYTGDGGPAINATMDMPISVATDASGNVYISDLIASVVRKVDVGTGIITTVVGNGTSGYSGDNGPATNAMLNNPYQIAIGNNGSLFIADNANQRVRSVTGLIATLPVKYISFTVERKNEQALLQWQTAEEVNNDFFAVEHSINARNWSIIGKVKAQEGSKAGTYSFTHASPASGVNYYRLLQVDIDGKQNYSTTIRINMSGKQIVTVYPNPIVGNRFTLDMGQTVPKAIPYRIIDMLGKTLQTGVITSPQQTIEMHNLKKGNYLLKMENRDAIKLEKE